MNGYLTLWGLYNYDKTIFEHLQLPENADKETVIYCIFRKYGQLECYYQDPLLLKETIKYWSIERKYDFDGIWKTTALEYEPIENYDRKEQSTRKLKTENTKSGTEKFERTGSITTEENGTDKSENEVSAFNSNDYSPASTVTRTPNLTTTESPNTMDIRTPDLLESEENIDVFEIRAHGNIGVTTSQQMLVSEREVRNFSFYEYVADKFAKDFLIRVY